MACKQYFVVLHKGQWSVKFEDQPEDPYPTQAKATRAAIDAAHLHAPATDSKLFSKQFATIANGLAPGSGFDLQRSAMAMATAISIFLGVGNFVAYADYRNVTGQPQMTPDRGPSNPGQTGGAGQSGRHAFASRRSTEKSRNGRW